jgi:hypothetical protein
MIKDGLLCDITLKAEQMSILNKYMKRLPHYTRELLVNLQTDEAIDPLRWCTDDQEVGRLKFFLFPGKEESVERPLRTAMRCLLGEEYARTKDEELRETLQREGRKLESIGGQDKCIILELTEDDVLSVTYKGVVEPDTDFAHELSTSVYFPKDTNALGIAVSTEYLKHSKVTAAK